MFEQTLSSQSADVATLPNCTSQIYMASVNAPVQPIDVLKTVINSFFRL